MAELGQTRAIGEIFRVAEVVEMLLGHKIKGVRGIYMKHKFLEERRSALRLWEQTLTAPEPTPSNSSP